MKTVVFDGWGFAREREMVLAKHIRQLGFVPRICSVVFGQDKPSQLYTRLKFEAAVRVGVEFDRIDHSITDSMDSIVKSIRHASERWDVHGVMIQKPGKRGWEKVVEGTRLANDGFEVWWQTLTAVIDPDKDVDCLTRHNLDLVYAGEWKVLPATVRAVVEVLIQPGVGKIRDLTSSKIPDLTGVGVVVVGRSELVGRPLAAVLSHMGAKVKLCGSKTGNLTGYLKEADVVVSATGAGGLITGDMVKDGVVVVDVGEPKPDVDFESVADKASFITPVPGGVGPVTVVSLLENLVEGVGR